MQCAEDQEESQNTFKQITKGGETLLGKSGRWAPILFFILCTRTHRHVVVHVCDVTRSQANSFTCVQLSTDGCKMLKKHSNGVKKLSYLHQSRNRPIAQTKNNPRFKLLSYDIIPAKRPSQYLDCQLRSEPDSFPGSGSFSQHNG